MRKGRITVLEANILYLITALLLVTIGAHLQLRNIKLGLIVTEYVLVLLPVIILLKAKNIPLKAFLRFNRLRLKHGLIVIGVMILTYPIAIFFNTIMITILSWLGLEIKTPPIPTASNFGEYIILFFIIAISAGICEEIFFRGLLSRVYEEKYKVFGILIPALMFGIFHFDLQKLLATTVLGLVFGYLVHITNSIYAGIIGHIANNGFIVTIMYVMNILMKLVEKNNINTEKVMIDTWQWLIAAVVMGFIAVVSGFFAYLLIKVIKKDLKASSAKDAAIEDNDTNNWVFVGKQRGFIEHIPILIVLILYIFIMLKLY